MMCGPLDSDQQLRNVFIDRRIQPWRDRLQESSNRLDRRDNLISLLLNEYNADKQNALILFLKVVAERTSEEVACHSQLMRLVEELRKAIGQTDEKENGPDGKSALLSDLRRMLVERFNIEELHTLCFELGLDYESLPGAEKESKARELVTHLDRHQLLSRLIEVGKQLRPDINWHHIFVGWPQLIPVGPVEVGKGLEIHLDPVEDGWQLQAYNTGEETLRQVHVILYPAQIAVVNPNKLGLGTIQRGGKSRVKSLVIRPKRETSPGVCEIEFRVVYRSPSRSGPVRKQGKLEIPFLGES